MKECDILGSTHTLTPPTYFQGVRTPELHDLHPVDVIRRTILCITTWIICRTVT